jgi:hypothetical protein
MLWMATATAMLAPSLGSSSAATKVAIPSGKLWSAMATAERRPMRMRCASGRAPPPHLLHPVHLVRVLRRRDQTVDEGGEEDPAEEGEDGHPGAGAGAELRGEARPGVGQDLDEGDVDHDAGREAEGGGEEAGVRGPGEERERAADAGREAGESVSAKATATGDHSMGAVILLRIEAPCPTP